MTAQYDANVRHAIYIERYKKRVAREIVELVRKYGQDLYDQIATSDLDQLSRRELDRLLRSVQAATKQAYEPIRDSIEAALKDFAVYEADWQANTLARIVGGNFGVPSDADLWSAMFSRPFQGKLLREWLRDLEANTAARVRQTIRQGYVDGLSPLEIARQIRGTRTRAGIIETSARGSEAMVRTAVAHTASAARSRTYEANPAIIAEQWASVLDHRTTAICWGRDGKIYDKGKGPRPPAHIGCRSTMLPVTENNRRALEVRPTYNDWLTRQPESVQDDILGQKRGKLFREGGYTVDRFTDKSGQEYTLDQLRAKDRETFDEVFAD